MKNLTPKTISGIIALFGVIALIGLESHISPDKSGWVTLAIIFAGVGRLYMFTEGATMENEKDRLIAFRTSIALTLSFIGYVVLIYYVVEFESYLLWLFLICTLTLLAVEWVFGRRTGYSKKAALDFEKYRFERLKRTAKAIRVKLIDRLNELESTLNKIKDELADKDLHIEALEDRLIQIESTAEANRVKIGVLEKVRNNFILINRDKYMICPNCNSLEKLPSNAARQLICQNEIEGSKCNTLIWQKEKMHV